MARPPLARKSASASTTRSVSVSTINVVSEGKPFGRPAEALVAAQVLVRLRYAQIGGRDVAVDRAHDPHVRVPSSISITSSQERCRTRPPITPVLS